MISSVRLDGTSACMTVEGATNTEVFRAYVCEILVPALRPGDIVVMDNLGAHKNEHTLERIRQAGAEDRRVGFAAVFGSGSVRFSFIWAGLHCGALHGEGRLAFNAI